MSTVALAPASLAHLTVGNEVTLEWVASAEPTRITTSMGTVVAISTETVHLNLAPLNTLKIINLERITGIWVHGLGAAALRMQAAASMKLHEAANAIARGDVVGAQEALATAMHFAPTLREEALS